MPKTNVKGGKKKKRGKNGIIENPKIVYIEQDDEFQLYGQVSKVLGNGRFNVCCFKKESEDSFTMEEKMCLIRGKMRKRNWINNNDVVIVSLREFEKDKADIVHKYNNDEARTLKELNLIPNSDSKELNEDVNFSYSNIMDNISSIENIKDSETDSNEE